MKTCMMCPKQLETSHKNRKFCDECRKVRARKYNNKRYHEVVMGGIQPVCIVCNAKLHKSRNEKYCDDCRVEKHRAATRKWARDHAISFKAPDGPCGLCKEWSSLVNDHDHKCCESRKSVRSRRCGNCEREAICKRCNYLLGCAKDSVDILILAIKYLERHENG